MSVAAQRRTVLVVGSGAREHALAWKLRQSPDVGTLYVAPGNAGTALLAENAPIMATDLSAICRFVEERSVDLTVIGPEAPLVLGLADHLRARGQRVVGPSAAAARLEASKSFAKEMMGRAGIPTAAHVHFDRPEKALQYLATARYPLVVKADGLAAGKGVVTCADLRTAREAVIAMMVARRNDAAGARVIIEEMLSGPEISLLAFVDGERAVALPLAQDHKRLGDGDSGPNTGGMGAYAPVPFIASHQQHEWLMHCIQPLVDEMASAGTPYRGVLYAGLMLTANGPYVLEFNCRLGDPEAQVLLPLLRGDVLPWLDAMADGQLCGEIPFHQERVLGVVLAAPGYPDVPKTGDPIRGLQAVPEDVLVFHAGTAVDAHGSVITAGGRVLTIVGKGATVDEAARKAYGSKIHFEGMQMRNDIAWQAREWKPSVSSASTPMMPPSLPSNLVQSNLRQQREMFRQKTGNARIAVLASGGGSNLQALLDASAAGTIHAQVVAVISHYSRARALKRARLAGIPAFSVPLGNRRDQAMRARFEAEVLGILQCSNPDLVVLAGWMLILSPDFLERCTVPLINVHPALLPAGEPDPLLAPDFPVLRGAHAVRDALALRLQHTGVSVHRVTPEVDAGPVILRELVPIEAGDDEQSLYGRIKTVEHQLLPRAVETILSSSAIGGAYA